MDDRNRGTGRTTRMIEAAKAAVAAGDNVLIVAHTLPYARELAARVGPLVAYAYPGNALDALRGSNRVAFVDHYAAAVGRFDAGFWQEVEIIADRRRRLATEIGVRAATDELSGALIRTMGVDAATDLERRKL